MKAIICEQIEKFKLVEVQEPSLRAGEAIVRIKRIGICGTDLHAYKGNQPFFSYPRILGHELAGYIEQIAEGVTGLKVGDQVSIVPYMHCGTCIACRNGKTNCCTDMKVLGVHIDGGMRELIALPVSHLIKTDGLTLDQAAMLEPLSIGAHAVRRSELRAGENVLVIGAGPIGLGVMILAKQLGANVTAMDINDERLAFCCDWAGIDHTINALQQPKEQLAALTNGEYPTVVFDATGNARSMTESFGLAAHGGKLVYVGLVKADITFHDPDFHKRELTLMSSRNATMEDFDTVSAAMQDGIIDIERYITHRATFESMIGQFETWLKPESKVIKAIVSL
ncbi:2-desacetyl-2-hydroxyethyl bacteriochlorophyllide A dehydrogenase [Paenibacillus sp. V4I3]|uniref:zinc-binding alcohol dehydrogenase family protein n=1 Tax=unclassified Paenibacillus TaxID=185978 RepID=UPI00277F3E75|nr:MULTISPECIES: zinc-binding alcohol dehydrogenase family protein [unclassified Paenibacillus]MDQ0878560.1 2-desacetyl-2-hydroxyethyl bacteriochlorophyllide A dehydrogenase [Paenibacillus sp. V4I3]MDQ0885582.1 2-desacetyl-2-hydroxyethyl bacteriochlorophyllide A dehydrogenase [Paenibacillus sp. V4I9]